MDSKNVLIAKFIKYLNMSYSNKKTKELYISQCLKFLNQIENQTGVEPTSITQDMFDNYAIFLNSKRNINPFYKGFIMAFRECFDPEDGFGRRTFAFRISKDKSREAVNLNEYDWLPQETIQELIDKTSTYISLTIQLFFETGLRKMELINLDLNDKSQGLDLEKRRITGVGKGNKEFVAHFSKQSADRLSIWLQECQDPKRPFMLFKKTGAPYKSQDYQYWYILKREADILGIKLSNGDSIHPHSFRHSLGRYLRREKKWDIPQIAKKLRHSDIKTTNIYSGATQEEIESKDDEVFDGKEQPNV